MSQAKALYQGVISIVSATIPEEGLSNAVL